MNCNGSKRRSIGAHFRMALGGYLGMGCVIDNVSRGFMKSFHSLSQLKLGFLNRFIEDSAMIKVE